MNVVRTRPAPNFSLSLKINLCDLRDLRVINAPPEAKAGAFAYYHDIFDPAVMERDLDQKSMLEIMTSKNYQSLYDRYRHRI